MADFGGNAIKLNCHLCILFFFHCGGISIVLDLSILSHSVVLPFMSGVFAALLRQ